MQRMAFSRFSTLDAPASDQFTLWRERTHTLIDALPSKIESVQGFRGEITRYVVNDFVFTDAQTDAISLARSVARVSIDVERDYLFHMITAGDAGNFTAAPRRRSTVIPKEGILVFDLNQPFTIERPATRVLSLFVRKGLFDSLFHNVESRHGRLLDRADPLTKPAFEHFVRLGAELPQMTMSEASEALFAAAILLGQSMQLKPRTDAALPPTARETALNKIRRFIDSRLDDELLTASSLIEDLELKRATVYRWFDEDGGLTAYIRYRRLRQAARDLIRYPRATVGEIAYGLGFTSPQDFARAFRRAFGMTPQDARIHGIALQSLDRKHGNG